MAPENQETISHDEARKFLREQGVGSKPKFGAIVMEKSDNDQKEGNAANTPQQSYSPTKQHAYSPLGENIGDQTFTQGIEEEEEKELVSGKEAETNQEKEGEGKESTENVRSSAEGSDASIVFHEKLSHKPEVVKQRKLQKKKRY